MSVKFDELKSVDIRGINLNDEKAVSIAIGKGYGFNEVPVTRIRRYKIDGIITTLPEEIHFYKCKQPIWCTALHDNKAEVFYWVHDFITLELRPVLVSDVENELKTRISQLKEVTKKELLEQMEILETKERRVEPTEPAPNDVYIPSVKQLDLPSLEKIAKNPKLLMDLPPALQIFFGNRLYDKRWYSQWHAKMMSLGGTFKRLYNPTFLSLKPENMVTDLYAPYLIGGRERHKAIDNIDMSMLGINDLDLNAWKG